MQTCSARRLKTRKAPWGRYGFVSTGLAYLKENNMKKLMTICFALALLTFGVASAQDNMHNDNMKGDASMKAVHVTGKVSDDGKMLGSERKSKSWPTNTREEEKGHEGHP